MKSCDFILGIVLITLCAAFSLSAQQQCATGATFTGPLTITTGGTYTGNWQSTDASVPALMIKTTEPVNITNSRLMGPGELILANARNGAGTTLTVQQSCFVGVNPNVAGVSKLSPIHIYNATSVLVENCDFEGGGFYGVWIQQYVGDQTLNNTIKILRNRVLNVDGRKSDGQGGYLTTDAGDKAHAFITSNVNGVPGIEIGWNQIINQPNQSRVEDSINVYDTSGTSASPVLVHDNYIQGGYAADPANANSLDYTGSAFTTDGDAQTNPNLTTAFVNIYNNQAVNVANVGLGIALGHDNALYSNRVVSSGKLADGTNISTTTASGINHNNYRNNPPGVFGNNSVHDNLSGLLRQVNGNWERFDYSFHVAPAVAYNNADWTPDTTAAPTLTDEANELLLWNEKLLVNNISVGSSLVVPALSGSLQIVSGNNQTGDLNGTLAAPLVVRVVNSAGAPVAGVNVGFMVATGNASASQQFAITGSDGEASSGIVLGTTPGAVQVNVIAAGYTGVSFKVSIGTQSAPSISAGGVVNGASFTSTVAPGSYAALFGADLSASMAAASVIPLPATLSGVTVTVNGEAAPLYYVGPNQINFQVPWDALPAGETSGTVNVIVSSTAGGSSQPVSVPVANAAPGILTSDNHAIAINTDGTLAAVPGSIPGATTHTAAAGDALTIYATGLGPVTPQLANGAVPGSTLTKTVASPTVLIGGVSAQVLFSGLTPQFTGINQINVVVPAGVTAGTVPLQIRMGGITTSNTVTVGIGPH